MTIAAGGAITREMIQSFVKRLAEPPQRREPVIYCHPIDAPFMEAMHNGSKDFDKVYGLWSECKRKYFIGGKRGIEKWGLRPLVDQYTRKLAAL